MPPRSSPRRSPWPLLLAALPLLGGGVSWAQLEANQQESVQPPVRQPEPESAQTPPAPLPPLPAATLAPLRPAASRPAAPPLRFDPNRLGAAPAPMRFDQSLEELVRQGVVSRSERDLIRGGSGLPRLDASAFRQACRGAALSARECRGDLALRWGRRLTGQRADGSLLDGGAFAGRVGADGLPLPPLTVPVSALLAGPGGAFNLASVFKVTPRPAPILGNGNRRLLLPLIGSAVNTSGFGWRLHPLLGIWRLHAGEDLAAPEGTPVVAALSGRVVSSGLAGGYGLAVELEHQRPLRRTIYGHLSELYVKTGEWVRQGEVVGRVGSTGLSTGPHLHFELRRAAEGGWVAMDPGDLDPGLGQGRGPDPIALLMDQLLQSLQRQRG